MYFSREINLNKGVVRHLNRLSKKCFGGVTKELAASVKDALTDNKSYENYKG